MGRTGILVYDRKDAEYNTWFIQHIIEEGRNNDLVIQLVLTEDLDSAYLENADLLAELFRNMAGKTDSLAIFTQMPDFAIMRNRNYEMSEAFENAGIRCFNSSYVCRIRNDKWEMYRDFSANGLPVMYTQKAKLPYPFVLKPVDGHGGENVFLIKTSDEYDAVVKTIGEDLIKDKFIYQFPASEKGRDVRAYVIGDTIITAMERRNSDENEFRANFSLGGSASEYPLDKDELKVVARVAKHINADFVGIDLIFNNGKPIVNEIEDAVGTRMLYSHTDIDAVKEYIKWIKNQLNG